MSAGIVFDKETSQRMVAVYETGDLARRRQFVLGALQLQAGEHVIDIGTGPGFLAAEMADAIGPNGRVHGLDISEPMLQLARQRCSSRPWVDFEPAAATALPVADRSFDVAVSVQVFEYVPDVDRALAETLRVLKPGGRAVVVATDWDSILWHSEHPERMRRVLEAFREHCAFSNLPRTLVRRMRQAGFAEPQPMAMTQFNPVLHPDTYSYHSIELVSTYVAGRGGVTPEEAAAWSDELHQLGARGQYFFCLQQFAFLAARPT